MVPAVGEKNRHHFRHRGGHTCLEDDKTVERANRAGLRQWIQEKIEDKKQLVFPSLSIPIWTVDIGDDIPNDIRRAISYEHKSCISYGTAHTCQFNNVLVAKPEAKLQPHLLCTGLDGKQYAVDIRGAGGVSGAREEALRNLGVPVLTIDIGDADYLLWKASEQEIDKYIERHTHWEIYPNEDEVYKKVSETLRQEALELMEQRERSKQEAQAERHAAQAEMGHTSPDLPWDIEIEHVRHKEETESEATKEARLRIALKSIDFEKKEQVRINGTRWVKCWACGEVKPEGSFVMCQYAQGLCRECHFDEGVEPRWQ
jgi:hypothetical protein